MASKSIPRLASRNVVVTVPSDSMAPTLHPGDLVEVDTIATTFEGDGIYLVAFPHGDPGFRRISRRYSKGLPQLWLSTDAAPRAGHECGEDQVVIVGRATRSVRIRTL